MSDDFKLSYISGADMSKEEEEMSKHRYSYEEAVSKFGTGKYQLLVCFMLSLVTWTTVTGNEAYIWAGAKMEHTCVLPRMDNSTQNLSVIYYIASQDQCTYSELKYDASCGENKTLKKDQPCTDWTYDQTFFASTIMSEWDLNDCNGKWKISLAASLYMVGFFIGCFLFGDLSDRFGRLNMFLVSHIGLVASGVGSAYSVNLEMLIALRCVFGIFVAGARNAGFVYMTEILTPGLRAWTGPITSITYAIFTMTNIAIAQHMREWRILLLITSLGCLWYIPYWFFLHESPHWCLAQGKDKHVLKYFQRSAKINNCEEISDGFEVYHHVKDAEKERVRYVDFMKTSNLRLLTLLVCMCWFFVSLVAFGFSYNVGNMSGNIFYNGYLTMSASPLLLLTVWIMQYGRRLNIIMGFMMIAVLSIVLAVLTSYQHIEGITELAIPILCALGRVLASFSFAGLYVITSELFATKMRVTALGLGSSCARVGGAIAPYIALSGDWWQNTPYILFGSISFLAGIICMSLPETLNKPLPETVEEMKATIQVSCPCINMSQTRGTHVITASTEKISA